MRTTHKTAAAVVAGAMLALTAHVPAHAAGELLVMTDPEITESSGLVWDPDLQAYWTTNDSGDSGRLFAVGLDGQTTGTFEFNAPVEDVEALARDRDGRVYVGDIGDNEASRDHITVYWFDQPQPDGGGGSYRAWDFTYPDGPQDAETMMVDAAGRLYIVTKGPDAKIYGAPTEPSSDGTNELEPLGGAPAFATDGVVLADGRFVVRTYTTLEVLSPDLYAPIGRSQLPFQEQGETVALLPGDANSVVVGSEGVNQALLSVPVPAQMELEPRVDPVPPTEPLPEPEPPQEGGQEEDLSEEDLADPRTNRSGTLTALVLALLASVAAGVYVWFRGRHDLPEAEPAESEETSVLGRRDPNLGYPPEHLSDASDLMPRPPAGSQAHPGSSVSGAQQTHHRGGRTPDAGQDPDVQQARPQHLGDDEDDMQQTLVRPEDWWR